MPLVFYIALLLLPIFYVWTSRLNHFFFFGRTVPAEFPTSADGRAITRRYKLNIWLGSIPAFGLGAFLFHRHNHTFPLWMVLLEAFAFYFAFATAHRAAGRLAPAAESRPAVEVPLAPTANPPSLPALLAPLISGVVILAIAIVYMSRGSSLLAAPQALDDLVSAHGGDNLFGFGLGIAFAGIVAPIIRFTARSRTPLGLNALRASMIATWCGVLSFTAAIGLSLAGGQITRAESKAVIFTAMLIAFAVVLFRTVSTRRYVPAPAEMQLADENWRWGLFYCNRHDPALFVQARCGAGFTLNYGRALAWPICATFVGFIVFIFVVAHPH